MIFVTIGTSEPFDRLLSAVDGLSTDEKIVAQIGTSTVQPRNADCRDYLSFDETIALMEEARVVLAHAGVGTVLSALSVGCIPVVAPRLRRYGEAVDDHQVAFARRLAEDGVVRLVEDLALLPDAIGSVRPGRAVRTGSSPLALDLRAYLDAVVGRS